MYPRDMELIAWFVPEGRDLAKHLGCIFMETSAKQPINVDEAFYSVVREIRKYNKVRVSFGGETGQGRHLIRFIGTERYPSSWWAAGRSCSRRKLG